MNKENMAYQYNEILFSHKNEILLFTGKWIELKITMLNEKMDPER
jgi:hypothetical protein